MKSVTGVGLLGLAVLSVACGGSGGGALFDEVGGLPNAGASGGQGQPERWRQR
jgi:hypothetical protein